MNKNRQKELARTGRSLLKLHTLGAAHAVTGSLFLFELFAENKVTRFILDVGLTVENQMADFQKRLPSGINAADIDHVIISHAHVDHCGYLPKLIKDGFKGKVFVTPATRDLMAIILPDSGYLQEEAAKRHKARYDRDHKLALAGSTAAAPASGSAAFFDNGKVPAAKTSRSRSQSRSSQHKSASGRGESASPRFTPLYTQIDGQEAIKTLVAVDYHQRRRLTPELAFTFTDAGHILGSAVVNLEIGEGSQKKTFCFTGNVGRRDMPLLRDLEPVKSADYLMLEATYGNRLHQKRDRLAVLQTKISEAYARAKHRDPKFGCGVILIPSFAVGRGQTVLNDLRILMESGRLPKIPVFVDGKMTLKATEVYKSHAAIMDDDTRKLLEAGIDPYQTPRQTSCEDWRASEALRNPHSEPVIIVGSSGMAAGGRIVNHLAHWLPGKQNTVVFVGYQGTGTLGQAIVRTSAGERPDSVSQTPLTPQTVRISGKPVSLRAQIEFIPDYSAHADYEDQLAWLKKFTRQPKMTFIVHGDEEALVGLKGHVEQTLGWKNVVIPSKNQEFEL
ncbi:MAG: MBL fold metallo-hydrolase [Cyanobacteria bacterium REEB67]|nr:MBL fold metallo-hydrolase [Cyanobacteria bacterium REEB67]